MEQYSKQSRKRSSQQWILKKAERHIAIWSQCREWAAVKFIQTFLASLHFLAWMMWYWYLYIKNYKVVYTYHQVFCCPESVNTRQENPMIYGANFMQCICTGYCENWILSLLSFIMNSWYHVPYGVKLWWWKSLTKFDEWSKSESLMSKTLTNWVRFCSRW